MVIEQGAGSPSPLWWPIQEKIAAFARVCTYDRAGYLWSEPVRRARSVGDRAEELHLLLANADLPGPYLLVGHSYGGLIARDFALRYPTETVGLVLVDTPDETVLREPQTQALYARMRNFTRILEMASRFGLTRLLQKIPSVRQALWFVRPDEYSAVSDDLASLKHLESWTLTAGELGDLPLAILTHGQPFPGPFAVLESGWMASQHRLAALSRRATLISAHNSNHMIHLEQPDLVIHAVRRMHSIASRNEIDPRKLARDE